MVNSTMKKRLDYIDLAKGVAILLVIVGHTVGFKYSFNQGRVVSESTMNNLQLLVRGIIFSFHMPLFFIVSNLTYNTSTNYKEYIAKIKKSFNHLMIPAFLIFFLLKIVDIGIYSVTFKDIRFFFNILIAILFSSGVKFQIRGLEIYAIGMLWFLVVLFFGRILYDGYQLVLKDEKKTIFLSLFLSVLGFSVSRVLKLPFSFDIALVIQPFFALNNEIKRLLSKSEDKYFLYLFSSFLVWIVGYILQLKLSSGYFELASRNYPLYPLSLFSAISGVIFVLLVVKQVVKFKFLKPIVYVGKNSFLMFTIHCFDSLLISLWVNPESMKYTLLSRLCLDILFFYFFDFCKKRVL